MTIFPGGGTGTSTFGSVAFWCIQQGARALPRRRRVAIYDRQKIPYGNNAVTQLAGIDTPARTFQIVLKTADYAALDAAVMTRATLTILGESGSAAVLVDAGDAKEYAEGYVITSPVFEF